MGHIAAPATGAARTNPYTSMKVLTPLNVSVDTVTSNTLSLLAAANNSTLSEFAARILTERAAEAHTDEAFMASLGRLMIEQEAIKLKLPKAQTIRPVKPKPPVLNEADGLPQGVARVKDGRIMSHKAIKEITFNKSEAGESLKISDHLISQAIKNGGIVPFALLGSKKFPRFTAVELEQIDKWLRTPCENSKGYKRTLECPVCGRFFSLQGMRLHKGTCSPEDRKPFRI